KILTACTRCRIYEPEATRRGSTDRSCDPAARPPSYPAIQGGRFSARQLLGEAPTIPRDSDVLCFGTLLQGVGSRRDGLRALLKRRVPATRCRRPGLSP